MKVQLLLSLLFLSTTLTPLVNAKENNCESNCKLPRFRSTLEQKNWFQNSKNKLSIAMKKPENQPLNGKSVTCSFRVTKSGEVDDLEVTKSSGEKAVDECAKNIVRMAQPFASTADNVLLNRGLCVEFSNGDLRLMFQAPVYKNKMLSRKPIVSPFVPNTDHSQAP